MVIAVASKVERLSEAFIGLIYAFGIATVFLILSKSPHGTEDFQRLLASDLLFVSLKDIYTTTGIYFLIGIALYLTGKFFKNQLKNIGFFLLFAITVTSSVKLAGVLVVFSLLVAPALVSLMMVSRFNLLFAWIYGILINLLGITISYQLDLPTGYTLVSLHSMAGATVFLWKGKPLLKGNLEN